MSTQDKEAKSFIGRNAKCTQTYDEYNKKAGVQWEASRIIEDATLNGIYYSIIKTGSKTVDLKSREFGYTGDGLHADIYINPTYTGGTPDPVYNMRYGRGNPEMQLLTGITVTDVGEKCGATIHAINNVQNQGKGSPMRSFATNRILEANTDYLLSFKSLSVQDIAARLEFYEGGLDSDEE